MKCESKDRLCVTYVLDTTYFNENQFAIQPMSRRKQGSRNCEQNFKNPEIKKSNYLKNNMS